MSVPSELQTEPLLLLDPVDEGLPIRQVDLEVVCTFSIRLGISIESSVIGNFFKVEPILLRLNRESRFGFRRERRGNGADLRKTSGESRGRD